jgi:hypothetical protein
MELKTDDIEVGMFVTVCRGPKRDKMVAAPGDPFGFSMVATGETVEDRSYQGDVLKVLAVDLPFIAAQWDTFSHPIKLDTRKFGLRKLSPEYVAAMQRSF